MIRINTPSFYQSSLLLTMAIADRMIQFMSSIPLLWRAARHFAAGTALSRISGLLRDITMAWAFGADPAVAAFLVAFRLSHLLRRLCGEGAMQSAFIPYYENLFLKSPKLAAQFFWTLNAGLFLFLGTLAVGIFFSIETLALKDGEILHLTARLFLGLPFICLYGINLSYLQCNRSYFLGSVAPVAFNGIWILGSLLLSYQSPTQAMNYLSWWVVIACIAQWIWTLPKVIHYLNTASLSLFDKENWNPSVIKKFLPLLFLGMLGIAATQINTAIDPLFALKADPSGPAYLWYAIRIQQVPLSLFGVAVGGALLPAICKTLQMGNFREAKQLLHSAVRQIIGWMFFFTGGCLLFSDPLVLLIYGHGDFQTFQALATSQCLMCYAVGLLPMTLVLAFAPIFYAQKKLFFTSFLSSVTVLINIILNSFFVFVLDYGAESIALATSISSLIQATFLGYVLNKEGWEIGKALMEGLLTYLPGCLLGISLTFLYKQGGGTGYLNLLMQFTIFAFSTLYIRFPQLTDIKKII